MTKFAGDSLSDAILDGNEHGMLDLDRSGSVFDGGIRQVRFTASDHQSAIRDTHSASLIHTQGSHGRLWSDYDGERAEDNVNPGIFYFIPAGVLQEYDFRGTTTNIGTSLPPGLITQLREQNPELSDIRLDEPMRAFSHPRLARLIVNQDRLIRSGEMGWRSLADANLVQLGIELMCLVARRKPNAATPLTEHEVAQAEAYLRANLDQNIPLSDIAELLGRDVFGFARAFKSATGSTFHQFSLQLRVTEAIRLLRDTTLPIAGIAYATGFSSQAHMTTTMGRIAGHTPGAVRKTA
ncbi:AraC family transcriptional regulator [Erythrobacter ani]|uniref:Helix-turn-helix transcriptional regulator n=1 Tax=Erythrobacter ani TaxID=2827235 RepID=A0ABS6SKB8_9SPHN|nr:AraC family transcriptional regulator [Erythrobacter ani]MBV7265458.1 helix-turn-helix transcriptional regulator [Erythrobacter ani]